MTSGLLRSSNHARDPTQDASLVFGAERSDDGHRAAAGLGHGELAVNEAVLRRRGVDELAEARGAAERIAVVRLVDQRRLEGHGEHVRGEAKAGLRIHVAVTEIVLAGFHRGEHALVHHGRATRTAGAGSAPRAARSGRSRRRNPLWRSAARIRPVSPATQEPETEKGDFYHRRTRET